MGTRLIPGMASVMLWMAVEGADQRGNKPERLEDVLQSPI